MHPEQVTEGQLTDINEKRGYHKKDEDVLEKVTLGIKPCTLKAHSEIFFMTWKVQRIKCWKMTQI